MPTVSTDGARMLPPDLNISVSDDVVTRESVRVYVSPIVLMGIATQLRFTLSVAPESHPHAQPTREPFATVDAATMSAVVAFWAIAALIRRACRDQRTG